MILKKNSIFSKQSNNLIYFFLEIIFCYVVVTINICNESNLVLTLLTQSNVLHWNMKYRKESVYRDKMQRLLVGRS